MKRSLSSLAWTSCLAALAASISAMAANPYVVLPDGRKVEGTEVRASREGIIYLTTAAGRIEYPKGTKVVMDQPQELVQAGELIQKKKFTEAIAVLQKVAEDSRFLGWDMKARKLLATAYNGNQEWKKAADAYEALMAEFKDTQDDGEVRSGYLQALAGNGDTAKVMPLLQAAITKGPRAEAVQAQMIRGQIRYAAGDIENALYDFMRTARYFREFKDVAAEAAFRAAECLEKLGDTERSGAYYRLVAQDYPDSPFAAQAKVKAGIKP